VCVGNGHAWTVGCIAADAEAPNAERVEELDKVAVRGAEVRIGAVALRQHVGGLEAQAEEVRRDRNSRRGWVYRHGELLWIQACRLSVKRERKQSGKGERRNSAMTIPIHGPAFLEKGYLGIVRGPVAASQWLL
jgi:hypothetical protein